MLVNLCWRTIDFETCRKLQEPLFCCLLHLSYMWHTDSFIQNFFTHGYPNDPTIIVIYLMLSGNKVFCTFVVLLVSRNLCGMV